MSATASASAVVGAASSAAAAAASSSSSRGDLYVKFIRELRKINANAPRAKVPKLLNTHIMATSPFPTTAAALAQRDIESYEIKRKSEMYFKSAHPVASLDLPEDVTTTSTTTTSSSTSSTPSTSSESTTDSKSPIPPTSTPAAPPTTTTQSQSQSQTYLTDIPLPNVLYRHVILPSPTYATQNSVGKITGFRIEVNGRRGTRTNKQILYYGKLATKDSARTFVDFGKADFYNKKGSTGVKVWIGYAR
ncbi:hypothetical protein HDU76_010127 [Blyttiomyces sp. JEL0837]|nr:hypothetical protein HDU76_010127 [Blyttiomyces sp. JEL0837]